MSYITRSSLATAVYLTNQIADSLQSAGVGSRHLNDLKGALDQFVETVDMPEPIEVKDPLNPQVRFIPDFSASAGSSPIQLPYETLARLRQSAADFEVTLLNASALHLAPDLARLRYLLAEEAK